MKTINLFETFSGIGSQFESLKCAAKKHKFVVQSIGAVEWYLDAIIAYQFLHFKKEKFNKLITKEKIYEELKDFEISTDSKKINKRFLNKFNDEKIRKIYPYIKAFVKNKNNFTNIQKCKFLPENIDIFTYSFPCQDLSSQGKMKGLDEGTRSSMIYEVERILKLNKKRLPKVLIMENVSNFGSKKFLNDLLNWTKKLKKIGYKSDFKILNSSDFGSPQSRSRIFLISWLDKSKKFSWPEIKKNKKSIKSIIDFSVDNFSLFENLNFYKKTEFKKTSRNIIKCNLLNYTKFTSENYVYKYDGFGPTLTASGANSRIKIFFPEKNKIRMLTDIECGQYMGFNKDKVIELKEQNFFTSSRLIFLFGNSIPVEMLTSIFNSVIVSFFK